MVKYDDQFKAIVLGAMLHDIGKFWQRADSEINYEKSTIIKEQTRNNISNICPVWKNKYSHKHSLWTNEFFEKFENEIKKHFNDYNALQQDNPANLASYHHNPSTELQHLIKMADWMSSGMDRSKSKDYEDEEEITGFRFRKIRLRPVFESVSFDEHLNEEHKYYCELKKLKNANDEIFPKTIELLEPRYNEDLSESYHELWDGFENDLKKLYANNFYQYIDGFLSLLENYTWSIASSTGELPDISLYDHLKTTAAIASALYKYHAGKIQKNAIEDRQQQKFILLGGDLSGIQKYIFDLVHTGISKITSILRARSFYLSVLPNIVVTKILTELELTSANCLMNSGGMFLLLLPNTMDTIHTLERINREINHWCKDEFYGELSESLDWSVTLSGDDFFQDGFKFKIDKLKNNLEIKKLKKLDYLKDRPWADDSVVISKHYASLSKNEFSLCQVCGKKPADVRESEIEEAEYICSSCSKHRLIGKELTKKSLLVISKNKPNTKHYYTFFEGNKTLYLYLAKDFNAIKNDPELINIETLTYEKEWPYFVKQNLIANYVPRFNSIEVGFYRKYYDSYGTESEKKDIERIKENTQKTFSDIAIPLNKIFPQNEEKNQQGSHLLAVIKADVDNLGIIFSKGLKKEVSISRYATMSRMLNLFFSGYLNNLLENNEKFKNIYTVYAGGDDLFLIGNWEQIIDFAPVLNQKFKEFTCNNKDIHLSAGITLIKPRRPVNKAADLAEVNLEMAKDAGKDRIAIFKTQLKWSEFEHIKKEWFEFFHNAYIDENSKINSSFLYRLLKYREMALDYLDNRKVEGLLFLSKLSYDLKRNIERQEGKPKRIVNEEELRKLKKLEDIHSEKTIKNIHIPIYYTLYKNRGGR